MFGGSGLSSRSNSIPASPAVTPVPMKRDAATIKQQALKRSFIHLLAVRAVSEKYMASVLHASTTDLAPLLLKFAKKTIDGSKYNLSDKAYKDLDPWAFPYKDESDRNGVIDRAVSAFDRLRISISDSLWQKLFKKEERGKGKTLSKLSNLSGGHVDRFRAPTIQIETPASSLDSTTSSTLNNRGRHLAPSDVKMRSKSEDVTKKIAAAKAKAVTDKARDMARVKDQKKIEVKKPVAKKPAGRVATTSAKVKSAEFIDNSDEEIQVDGIAAQVASSQQKHTPVSQREKTRPVPQQQTKRKAEDDISPSAKKVDIKKTDLKKAAATTTKPIIEKVISKVRVTAASKPEQMIKKSDSASKQSPSSVKKADQTIKKAPETNMKRSISSSSSSQIESTTGKKRIQESQRPVAMVRSISAKKGTSPVKPSPLGSSPPTNASDFGKGKESKANPTISSSSSSSGSPLINQRRERLQLEAKRDLSKILPASYKPGQGLKRRADDEVIENGANRGLTSSSSSDQSSKRPRLSESSASNSESDRPSNTSSTNTSPSVGLSERDIEYARSYKVQWAKYTAAREELGSMENPPPESIAKLYSWHDKLVKHRATIYSWKDTTTSSSS